ncbi:MAG TPA: polysaccharide deacetylase family protein [Solirubrobacterales bacterium]|nr:polysaccharide deacetylase family protein [Solirubrobacterales bacterium]
MASEGANGPEVPDERRQALQRRRVDRKRQIRRRRIVAFGALAAVIVAVIAVIALASGGRSSSRGSGSSHIARQSSATTGKQGGEKGSGGQGGGSEGGKVRNSTPQPDWEPHTGPVPILEYHVLGEPEGEVPYPELYVSRPDFRHQLEWLDENGYQAVTLEQVEAAWYHGGTLPPKPVVLSFDDGYRPQFTFALPQLRKHGWAGVLNLKAEGSDLYESNVKAMIAAGWELAAHTIHHLDLTELGPEQLEEEVAGSKAMLEGEFHVEVKNFCYPAGQFDETVIAAVEKAGYVGATTEIPGYAEKDAPYELARFEILGSTGVEGLAQDLETGEGETGELGA